MKPETLEEWRAYVEFLDERELFQQAISAGSMKFMETLLDEGKSPEEVSEIQKVFALRFLELGLEPPAPSPECLIDYGSLLGT